MPYHDALYQRQLPLQFPGPNKIQDAVIGVQFLGYKVCLCWMIFCSCSWDIPNPQIWLAWHFISHRWDFWVSMTFLEVTDISSTCTISGQRSLLWCLFERRLISSEFAKDCIVTPLSREIVLYKVSMQADLLASTVIDGFIDQNTPSKAADTLTFDLRYKGKVCMQHCVTQIASKCRLSFDR